VSWPRPAAEPDHIGVWPDEDRPLSAPVMNTEPVLVAAVDVIPGVVASEDPHGRVMGS
jgi:hypothetical protein